MVPGSPAGGDFQEMHGLAAQELPDRGSDHGSPVSRPATPGALGHRVTDEDKGWEEKSHQVRQLPGQRVLTGP